MHIRRLLRYTFFINTERKIKLRMSKPIFFFSSLVMLTYTCMCSMGEKEFNLFVKKVRDTFEYVSYLVFAVKITFFYLAYSYCSYLCMFDGYFVTHSLSMQKNRRKIRLCMINRLIAFNSFFILKEHP